MQDIKHIIYLMLENRSMDNVLGWMYENDSPKNFVPKTNTAPFMGVNSTMNNKDANGNTIYLKKIMPSDGQTIPSVDPHEDFENVKEQIANNMGGFYQNFCGQCSKNPAEIMMSYSPESLPVLNSLAKNFAVSDAYFSSIPTQTNCNRAFSLSGNSIGLYYEFSKDKVAMVDNYWQKTPSKLGYPYTFTERTIWDVLSAHGYGTTQDWMVFYNQTWPGITGDMGTKCFTQLLFSPNLDKYSDHFKDFSTFYSLLNRPGGLPTFSYLEPTWYEMEDGIGHNGNDYHPPGNTACGEAFLYDLYQRLQDSPDWKNTLLIVNFDEHGGTFDHVLPPADGDPARHVVYSPWEHQADGTPPPYDTEFKFKFKNMGVRVPLILVSPLIPEKTVFRAVGPTPYDHTSVIATILTHFNIPRVRWQLGSRTAHAPTFENVVSLSASNARTNVSIARPLSNTCVAGETARAGELQEMVMHMHLVDHIRTKGYSMEIAERVYAREMEGYHSAAEMTRRAHRFVKRLNEEHNLSLWTKFKRFLCRAFGCREA